MIPLQFSVSLKINTIYWFACYSLLRNHTEHDNFHNHQFWLRHASPKYAPDFAQLLHFAFCFFVHFFFIYYDNIHKIFVSKKRKQNTTPTESCQCADNVTPLVCYYRAMWCAEGMRCGVVPVSVWMIDDIVHVILMGISMSHSCQYRLSVIES